MSHPTKSKPSQKLNTDVAKLYQQFDHSLEHYHEIHFTNSIQQIRQKWPLLEEINRRKNT